MSDAKPKLPAPVRGSRTLSADEATKIRDEYESRLKTVNYLAVEFDVPPPKILQVVRREMFGDVR